jgi:hypothetical protein
VVVLSVAPNRNMLHALLKQVRYCRRYCTVVWVGRGRRWLGILCTQTERSTVVVQNMTMDMNMVMGMDMDFDTQNLCMYLCIYVCYLPYIQYIKPHSTINTHALFCSVPHHPPGDT